MILETESSWRGQIMTAISFSKNTILTLGGGEGGRLSRGKGRLLGTSLMLASLVTPSACSLSADEQVQPPGSVARSIEHEIMLADLRSGGLEVRGMVLDADTAQPILSLQMIVIRGYFDDDPSMTRKTEKIRQRVDGAFHYQCEPCIDLQMTFIADGYHSESLHLGGIEERFEKARTEKALPTRNILLKPVRNPVDLRDYRARLVVDADPEKSRVLLFAGSRAQNTSLKRAQARAEKSTEKSTTPLRYLRLATTTDASGQPQFDLSKSSRYAKFATSAAIDFSTADGGVVIYDSTEKSPVEIRRAMKEAPVEGYQPILALDPKAQSPVYFFVRIDDLYGRGVAHPPVLEQTRAGHRLVAAVELDLNPDGSRNLETVE